jgi:serine/threonine-protein kinase
MGVVVAARHLSLGHRVAIKYLPQSAHKDAEAVQRFTREAWAAAQLASPHVVRVTEVASLPSGAPFIVMEYLDGEDLAQFLEHRHRVPAAEAVAMVLPVCEAIAEAHAIGIVHRDLKPSNIFCVRTPGDGLMMKVLDFGISKLTNGAVADFTLTTTRTALGSPLYMSPEQMHSAKVVDARTDIWALGVILFELVAGRRPFDATSLPELAIKVATEAPAALREICSDLPRGFERIVLRCLEKDRTKRYPSVAALASALAPYAPQAARTHAERAARVSAPASAAPLPSGASRFASAQKSPGKVALPDHAIATRVRKHAVSVLLVAAAIVALLGFIVLFEVPATVSGGKTRTPEASLPVRSAETSMPEAPSTALAHSDQSQGHALRDDSSSAVATRHPEPEPAERDETANASPAVAAAQVVHESTRATNAETVASIRKHVASPHTGAATTRKVEPNIKDAPAAVGGAVPAARTDQRVLEDDTPAPSPYALPRSAGENMGGNKAAASGPVTPPSSDTQELGGRL